jgi:hypothetical protein
MAEHVECKSFVAHRTTNQLYIGMEAITSSDTNLVGKAALPMKKLDLVRESRSL